jgi:hypothetical protein
MNYRQTSLQIMQLSWACKALFKGNRHQNEPQQTISNFRLHGTAHLQWQKRGAKAHEVLIPDIEDKMVIPNRHKQN